MESQNPGSVPPYTPLCQGQSKDGNQRRGETEPVLIDRILRTPQRAPKPPEESNTELNRLSASDASLSSHQRKSMQMHQLRHHQTLFYLPSLLPPLLPPEIAYFAFGAPGNVSALTAITRPTGIQRYWFVSSSNLAHHK